MKDTVKLGVILLVISAVAAGLLGFSNAVTSEKIAEADKIANEQARQKLLGEAESFVTFDDSKLQEVAGSGSNILEISEGYDASSNLVGYIFKANTSGFGGDIQFMLGVSTEGHITGIEILSHSESPGLGANLEKSYFTDSFKGKSAKGDLTSASEPTADNEIQALTSSTITTNAMLDGVNKILEIYNSKLAN
ncbi:MAG: RnfABCDGE type electron transport complex subunit G [Tissierellia bacterium]|nr:RnfABCDGE type electron transport complex subunit G [Tissierellia bacterium]